jgi:WD40 repeat protein
LLRSIETFPETPPPLHVLSLGVIAFSSDGEMIAVGSRSGGIHRKYSDGKPAPIGKGEPIEEFPRDPLRVFRVSDGSLVASSGEFPGGFDDEYKLAWSPTSHFIAFLDADRQLRLWNPRQSAPPTTALKLERRAGGIVFSPDGKQLAINFADGVKIFNVSPTDRKDGMSR